MDPSPAVDSASMGDPARFRSLAELEAGLRALGGRPADRGRIAAIVSRRDAGRRHLLGRALLTADDGVPGDAWARRQPRLPEAQIAVMDIAVAELIANGQPIALFGDNLFLDLDLSAGNLPIGSRLRAGGAVLEVTPKPHNGCGKFRGRFGDGALRFVSAPALRHRNLRGIYLRTIEAGEIAAGDRVDVLERARPGGLTT